jgi:hypothetical protein
LDRNPANAKFQKEWDDATAREKRSNTLFAQRAFQTQLEDVALALEAVREAVGTAKEVEAFAREAFKAYGASIDDRARPIAFNLFRN